MEPADSKPTRRRRSSEEVREDARIVGRIADGDAEALSDLYGRYSGMLVALAHRVVGDGADAEEVLQEVFLQVWNQADRYDRSRSSVSTWLVLITRSRAIDRLRSRRVLDKAVTAAEVEKPTTNTSPEGVADVFMLERRARLRTEMAELPSEQRQVLEMAFYQGLTQREIAERTKTPLGTVKTRTLLAMKKLRAALQEEIKELL